MPNDYLLNACRQDGQAYPETNPARQVLIVPCDRSAQSGLLLRRLQKLCNNLNDPAKTFHLLLDCASHTCTRETDGAPHIYWLAGLPREDLAESGGKIKCATVRKEWCAQRFRRRGSLFASQNMYGRSMKHDDDVDQ